MLCALLCIDDFTFIEHAQKRHPECLWRPGKCKRYNVGDRLVSMMNPISRVSGEVSPGWSPLLTMLNDIGVRRLDGRMGDKDERFVYS